MKNLSFTMPTTQLSSTRSGSSTISGLGVALFNIFLITGILGVIWMDSNHIGTVAMIIWLIVTIGLPLLFFIPFFKAMRGKREEKPPNSSG